MSDINIPGARAVITADTSGFRAAVGQAQNTLLALEPVVARQWWGLQNLSRAFGGVGTAVAGGFGLAVREAIAWESAMVGVERTTGASGTALEDIEEGIRRVAQTTPIAVSELASLAEQAGALGISNEGLPEFVRIMGTLIASTNLTENSVDDLARTMNILGVPEAAFERFSSTLIEVGRNTAATETEILNISRRLASYTRIAGFSAAETLGLGAAIISLGPRAEAGASAAIRAMNDISTAIAGNGDDMRQWAAVADLSSEQFTQMWSDDASGALEKVIQGIAKYGDNAVALSSVLSGLDQENIRNAITLGSLAAGIQDVGNEQTSLIAINNMAEEAWRANTATATVAERRASTFAAQIVLLRNQLSEVGNTIGKAVLPTLKLFVGFIQNLVAGFSGLPGPVQLALGAIVAVVGAISLLAGGILAMIGPLVLMAQTFRTLRSSLAEVTAAQKAAKPSTDAMTGALDAQAAAAARVIVGYRQLRNEQGQFAGKQAIYAEETAAASAATSGAGVAAAGAGKGFRGLWASMSKVARIGVVVAGIAALATAALAIFGAKQREAAAATERKVEADMELVSALEQVRKGNEGAADEVVLNQIAMAGLATEANRLGNQLWGLADVLMVIQGTASADTASAIVTDLQAAEAAGDEAAGTLLNYIATQNAVYKESALAAGILSTAREDLGLATEDAADAEQLLADNTEEARKAQDEANQAIFDYVDAVFAQRMAIQSVVDAQKELTKAQSDAADPAQKIAEAENDLLQARNDSVGAQQDLADAEEQVLTARSDQLADLRDAEDALADSQDKYIDSLAKITAAEEALAKVRDDQAFAAEITDATNKLADAHLRLRDAERQVEDAEWQLAYLRGEGASARAIEDAEFALDEARQEVANSTQDVSDLEQELADLRENRPQEIADAERDLAAARRDSNAALRDISEREDELRDIRDDIANDTAYKDAVADVASAQGQVYDALQNVAEAEQTLADIRAGALDDAVLKAQQDLERALYDQARAATEVEKQQAAMRGEMWDAGTTAQALADNLALLLDQAPTPEARQRLQDYIDLLRTAVPTPEAATNTGAANTGGGPAVGPADYGDILPPPDPGDLDINKESWWETALSGLGPIIGLVLGPKLLSGIGSAFTWLATAIAGGSAAMLAAALAIVLALFAFIWWWFSDPQRKADFMRGVDMIWGWITGFFGDLPGRIGGFFTEAGDWLWNAGDAIIHGLWLGIQAAWNIVLAFFEGLGRLIAGFFIGVGTWLWNTGRDLVNGLWQGIQSAWNAVWGFLSSIGSTIIGLFTGAGSWLYNIGRNIVNGLINGLTAAGSGIWSFITGIGSGIVDAFRNAGQWLLSAGQNIVIGLANGIASLVRHIPFIGDNIADTLINGINNALGIRSPSKVTEQTGIHTVEGLLIGLLGMRKYVHDAAQQIANAAVPDLARYENVMAQFSDGNLQQAAINRAAFPSPNLGIAAPAPEAVQGGDQISITGADERDAIDIAEEVMFRKLVRTRG